MSPLESKKRDGSRHYKYRAAFAEGSMLVDLALNRDGKIAALQIRSEWLFGVRCPARDGWKLLTVSAYYKEGDNGAHYPACILVFETVLTQRGTDALDEWVH